MGVALEKEARFTKLIFPFLINSLTNLHVIKQTTVLD